MTSAYLLGTRHAACIWQPMTTSVSDTDIDRIAHRVLTLLAERLSAPSAPPPPEKVPPTPPPVPQPRRPKLAYTVHELAKELGVSPITIYRLDKRGLLRSSGATRRKIYPHAAVESFLSKTTVGGWSV